MKNWDPGHNRDHFVELNKLDCPVYCTAPIPVVEKQILFPYIEVFKHFKSNYFLGSPSLMLALAVFEHDMGEEIDEIRVFGVDTSDPSHSQQRQSWTFWLSKITERGIQISGTGADCLAEYEKDDGLRGLREEIGRALLKDSEYITD